MQRKENSTNELNNNQQHFIELNDDQLQNSMKALH